MPSIAGRGAFILCFLVFLPVLLFAGEGADHELEPIVVSKSDGHLLKTYALSLKHAPYPAAKTPLALLTRLPLDLQSRNPFADIQSDLSLRAADPGRLVLSLDGKRINDPQSHHYDCDIPFTSEDIERLEVAPGPGGSFFGADAASGAVNIVSKRPREKKFVFESGLGYPDNLRGLASLSEKSAALGLRFSQEHQAGRGFREGTDFRKSTSSFSSSYLASGSQADLDFAYQEKEFGAYDFYTPSAGYPSGEKTRTYLLNSGLALEKEGLTIKPELLWRRHYDKFILDRSQRRSRTVNHHRSDMYIPGLCLYRNSEQAGDTQIKAEYSLESMRSDRLGDHYRRRRSIFLKQEKEADFGLGLQAWARIDSYNRSDDLRTAGLNSRYRLSSHNTLSAGLSRNVRLPSFTELYYDDPTTSGSSGLGKEQYLNYQAGLEHQDEVVCYGGIFFLRKEDNPIDWVKHQPDDNRWQAENLADTEVFGSEAFFRLEPDKRFCLSLNYSYADKRRDNRGYLYKYGQSYLRHLAQAAAEIRSAFGEIFIASRYKKKSGRSSWFLAEAGFSRQLNRDLRFFLRVDNLFNQEYQEIEGIPQPGRSLEAGLRAEW